MFSLTIHNLSRDNLVVRFGRSNDADQVVASSTSSPIPRKPFGKGVDRITLSTQPPLTTHCSVHLTEPFRASWRVVSVPRDCHWRIYHIRPSAARQDLAETTDTVHPSTQHRILVFPRRDLSAFLSEIPDAVPLSSLSLPGTHDSMAFYGWPFSQCQTLSTPLAVQLQYGIRILDIRLAVIDSRLISYHGLYPQKTPFQEILSVIHAFLTAPHTCREALVMSIKQEDYARTSPVIFSKLVHEEICTGPGGMGMWFLDNRVPNLGEVRGKVLMFSRFGGDGSGWERGLEGLGMHPTAWPDSEKAGFEWMCKDTVVRTQDWYDIGSFLSIPEKAAISTRVLVGPPNPPTPTLAISYFSAASIPFAFPTVVARGFGWPRWGLGIEGVNQRVGMWLLDMMGGNTVTNDTDDTIDTKAMFGGKSHSEEQKEGSDCPLRIRGWTFADFYSDPDNGLAPLLVECNFLE